MKHLILFLPLLSCTAQEANLSDKSYEIQRPANKDSLEIVSFFEKHSNIQEASKSIGTVSNGSLENAKLVPFYGKNFTYFDKDSYLLSRAFTSDQVKEIILEAYDSLYVDVPDRKFFLMELSNHDGGEIFPHRTHQNGLSVDFMLPKLKENYPNYELDTIGKRHYFLTFTDDGSFKENPTIKIDFDLVAKHILRLAEVAKKYGYSIEKVILKIEYKDELFATSNGKLLKESGIYLVKSLSPEINAIHDDHFHVDFKKL